MEGVCGIAWRTSEALLSSCLEVRILRGRTDAGTKHI